jgi:hypothetical protein
VGAGLCLAAAPAAADIWSAPAPLNSNAATDAGDDLLAQLSTDGLGAWVAVWSSDDSLGGTIGPDLDVLFARSTDGGASWSEPAPLGVDAATDAAVDLYPQVTTDGLGTWIAVWDSFDSVEMEFRILFARSTDGGATWSEPASLHTSSAADSDPEFVPRYPQLTTDGLGTWIAVWGSDDDLGGTIEEDFDILLARSTDAGVTWSDPAPLGADAATDINGDFAPQLTTDRLGTWVAVWNALGGPASNAVLFARSTDAGASWSDPAPLFTGQEPDLEFLFLFPQLTTDRMGTWVAVWNSDHNLGGTLGADPDVLFARSTDGGASWSDPAPLDADAASDSKEDLFPQLTTDGLGTWVAVWNSGDDPGSAPGSDADVLYARSSDGGASWSVPVPLNSDAATDSREDFFPQLTADGLGTWVAVWTSGEDLPGADADILFTRAQGLGGCTPSTTGLCLNGSRFRVGTSWRTPHGGTGEGQAMPLTDDTGYFWFFNPANVEMVAKVLDACVPPFDRFWVFAGGLTNVEVTTTVVDTETEEVQTYINPLGTPFQPLQDTDAFDTCSAGAAGPGSDALQAGVGPDRWPASRNPGGDLAASLGPHAPVPLAPAAGLGTCTPDATSLCLNGSRFRVTAEWRTPFGTMGPAQAEPLTDDTGYFWFFNPANVEMVVKVLDACVPPFDRFWVFAGGLTNVEVITTVFDTATDEVQVYTNPLGTAFRPLQDTDAFDTCP